MSPLVEAILLKTLFAGVGLGFLVGAVVSIKNGYYEPGDCRRTVRREKHPIRFWTEVIFFFLLSVLCFWATIFGKVE